MDWRRVLSRVSPNSAQKEKEKDSFFLAVKISSTTVLSTVWTVVGGKISIGEIGSAQLAGKDYEHLLKACDQSISQSSIKSAPDVEKVIFAVPFDWISDGKILPDHLHTLRRICKELDLIPLGYVVTIEALENFYKEVEGAPLTAILIGIDEAQSMLTIYRAGKDLGTVPVALNQAMPDQIGPAVEAAIKRFPHIDALPSRIILYNSGSDLDEVAQRITAYPWTGKLPFLHFPKVEKAPADFVIKAVAAAGGLQMGASLDADEFTPIAVPPQEIHQVEQERQQDEEQPSVPVSAPPFEEHMSAEFEEVSPQEAGFVTQTDFDQINIPTARASMVEEIPAVSSPPQQSKSPFDFKKLTAMFPKLSLPKTPPIFIPAAILIVLIILGLFAAAFYFLPKATLVVGVKAQNFNHDLSVAIATDTSEPTGDSLPGSFATVSEIGTKSGPTTGQKLVGDPAKGSVTIYSTSEPKTFAKGTTLTSASGVTGLKFTLDSDAKVASGDAATPSTVNVNITASDIGDKYNLASGTKFSFASLSSSDYLAKNSSAFSGGKSHQATVVTKDDQDSLMSALTDQLASQAKTDLQSKISSNQTLLPNAITSAVSKKKFSKNIDDEASSVSLDLTIDFKGVVFSKDDAVKIFADKYSSDIPQGYSLTTKNSNIDVTDATTDKKGNTTLTLSAKANLAPEINTQDIVSHSSGKSFAAAQQYASKLPGVSDVTLQVQPSFFATLSKMFLPWKKDNLKVQVVTQ